MQKDLELIASHNKGLSVEYKGKPALLAVISSDGSVVTSDESLASSVYEVCTSAHRNFLEGQGFIKTYLSPPCQKKAA